MADLLARYGATRSTPDLDEHERFLRACFGLDREEAGRLSRAHPDYLQSPAAMFEAARRDRPDVLGLLLELGAPLEVQDPSGKRALHEAAANNALRAARLLVERGSDIDPRESVYNGTPIGWAAHGDRTGMVQFLSRHSRDIWTLCFNGYVDRVQEILTEDPDLARAVASDGRTPLWWLPDDEVKAMRTVDLLLAAGADPSAASKDGETAAHWARRRGMHDVATRLEMAMATSPGP
jgi:ankyrin repeat protein